MLRDIKRRAAWKKEIIEQRKNLVVALDGHLGGKWPDASDGVGREFYRLNIFRWIRGYSV